MNKAKQLLCAIALLGTTVPVLASCGESEVQSKAFNFTISLKNSDNARLAIGQMDQIVINANNAPSDANYTVVSRTQSVVKVDSQTMTVTGLKAGNGNIVVTETTTGKQTNITVTVYDGGTLPATGGYNYSSASGAEAIARRTEILGSLEKYAIDSHLTGITLFENGGKVKYSNRIRIPANEYVTGYGFGILTEGDLLQNGGALAGASQLKYPTYLNSSQTNNTYDINAWNATGSQISDLFSYISSSYWSTRLNSSHNEYEWYPCLAADTIKNTGEANKRPVPVGQHNDLGLYDTWKIYVKTTANMEAQGKTLRFSTANPAFQNDEATKVTLDDYEFAYRLLLTGKHGMSRGAEMAGDKTYGIKGAQTFYNRTKNASDASALATWREMKRVGELGIKTGSDEGGDYIQLQLVNEIDDFTAMYTLSSNLISPMKESFILSIGAEEGDESLFGGVQVFGKKGKSLNIPNHVIGVAPYRLTEWSNTIAFTLNDNWFEKSSSRYLIPGVAITTYDSYSSEQLWDLFDQGLLDSCGVPIKLIGKTPETDSKGKIKTTKGDSTFKLNVNSCTQSRWEELFGTSGKIAKNTKIDEDWGGVKPWMSNDDFLNGLYWSIDRNTFANARGVVPSINYFADSYLSDPENGISYNSTPAHEKAVAKYHSKIPQIDPETGETIGEPVDNYGYDVNKAHECFNKAIITLLSKGQISEGQTLNIHIRWMYSTDTTEYGDEIIKYFEKAFNECSNAIEHNLKLKVNQKAVTNWEDVYNKYMMVGQFDLAFGAISGNSYNPLNFLEVLKSDNSSTFTLNWGPDTSKVDSKNPIIYDGKKWSFDGLWEVSDRGGVVSEGEIAKTVQSFHTVGMWNDLRNGGTVNASIKFIEAPGVDVTIDKVVVYTLSGDTFEVECVPNGSDYEIKISKELGGQIFDAISSVVNKNKQPGTEEYKEDIFTSSKYGTNFTFDVYYTLRIQGSTPTQSVVSLVLTAEDENLK